MGNNSDRHGEIPSLLNNRKRSADDVIQGSGEDTVTVKKVTARRGRPVKGTVADGMFNVMPDILGGNRIYDANNFRNNGEINDRNYNTENHGNQLPESTLYRVDHNGNYEAIINTGSNTTIVQPKILKKPRKQNNNNPKTIRIYKNKKDLNNNILISTNEENEKNMQNNNSNQSRGDKSEINAMDALFWALDQQESIKLKQLEKDKEKDKDKEKEKKISNGKSNGINDISDNNDVDTNGKLEFDTKEEEKNDDNVNNNNNNSNNEIEIETNEKFDNNSKIETSSENEKIKENGDEEEKVHYEITKNE